MSETAVKALWPGEKEATYGILKNSWGSAPVIWDSLAIKYLGVEPFMYMEVVEKLWPLYKRVDVPLHQRAVLMMTFDRAYVIQKDFQRAADDIRKYLTDFPPKPNQVNHWETIARMITQPDFNYPAFGLHCTSVSENPWQGPWNEEIEDYDPLDWSTAFNIYEELDNVH